MPRLTVWYIRSSLLYLMLGFTLGTLMLFNKGFLIDPRIWRLLPTHIEALLFGWTLQLVIGMGFWILPRFSKPPIRGNEMLAWGAFLLINAGIILIVIASFTSAFSFLTLTGRVAEALGVLAFAAHAFPRIKGFASS
jgi:cbb3-type cytochrome oxidase subunit 1